MTSIAPGLPGVWPALMTPLDATLAIDHVKFAAHARALLEAGCGGVTPFGTTGEGPSFSPAERGTVMRAVMVPASLSMPNRRALTTVAERIACSGVMPNWTMRENWRALSPCGNTPASVPNPMRTPAATAARKPARWVPVVSSFLRRISAGQPSRRPTSAM